ncbi:uncharacterized protein LOC110685414 [Chenopodium quinoa]|uniref:Uncharacterized protein n=1 Tax=Chenopodium quinoa TaxID=63459 RepID=A0A803N985_CHEQI|nr:uncharacterized protein LOC110685414 [Chenopodium quinoa]
MVKLVLKHKVKCYFIGPKSGYTRGKGSGYGGSSKARLQQEQQQNLRKQQDQIAQLQCQLEASKKEMEEYKLQQQRTIEDMEKRLMMMINGQSAKTRLDINGDDDITHFA